MALVVPKVFWNLVKLHGGPLETALAKLLPNEDWSWLSDRTKTLSEKAQANLEQKQEAERLKAALLAAKESPALPPEQAAAARAEEVAVVVAPAQAANAPAAAAAAAAAGAPPEKGAAAAGVDEASKRKEQDRRKAFLSGVLAKTKIAKAAPTGTTGKEKKTEKQPGAEKQLQEAPRARPAQDKPPPSNEKAALLRMKHKAFLSKISRKE